jgi:hypothetical protein
MKKEQIEMRIKEIGTLVLDSQKEQSNYTGELASLHNELAMLNAPTLTEEQAVELNDRLCDHVDSMDNTDVGNFDFEFNIDYDNRIEVVNFDCSDLIEGIKNEFQEVISDFFKVEGEKEEEDE